MLFAAAAASVGIFTSTASSASNAHVSKLLDCDEGGPLCAEPVDPIGYGGALHGPRRALRPVLLEHRRLGGLTDLQADHPERSADPSQAERDRWHLQLPGPHRLLVRSRALRRPVRSESRRKPARRAADSVHAEQRLEHLRRHPASDPDYIGKHPGTAFMELQFYPPGWVQWPPGVSCDPAKWCAALAIFQLNQNQNTGVNNNADCLGSVGRGAGQLRVHHAERPADRPAGTARPDERDVRPDAVEGADDAAERRRDGRHPRHRGRADGRAHDQTSGQSGSMVAGAANGFATVNFDPSGSSCTESPHTWHPAYSTSSEHTRVPWAAHGYNVSFSDEIGHFEYCSSVDEQGAAAPRPAPTPSTTSAAGRPRSNRRSRRRGSRSAGASRPMSTSTG